MKHKKGNKIQFHISAKVVCFLFGISGLALIAISCIDFQEPATWWTSWGKATANNAGTTLLVAGVISFLMEVSTLKSFFKDCMKNILNDDFPFDAYSKENLVDFKNRISAHQFKYKIDKKDLVENTVYAYEKKLLDLAEGRYYEKHSATYKVYPNEKEGVFRINATMDYVIINNYAQENAMLFKTKSYKIDGRDNNFELQSLTINDKPCSTEGLVKKEVIDKQEDSNFYDFKIKIEKDLGTKKRTKVSMKYQYFVPITDRLQNYKITLPCRNLEHEIRIKGDWQLRGSAFTAFYFKQGDIDSKLKIEQTSPDTFKIKFNDWVLPGGGYSIYYDNKK